jgi:protein-tyrosine-phosphatase
VSPVEAVEATRVLFVCTHNSARSIMAEALLRDRGGNAFVACSAGTEPGEVRPLTLQVLEVAGLPIDGLRSKSLDEFIGQRFDYVVTVCASARERCPSFPGEGKRLHWGYDDPSIATGTDDERREAFQQVFAAIAERIDILIEAHQKAST